MGEGDWVRSLGLDKDGTLFVELKSGITLFDSSCHNALPQAVRIRPEDLVKVENRRLYFCFLSTLNEISEIIYKSTYDWFYEYKNGDVVVDAGARIGTFTVKASLAIGEEGKVIAVEPEPRNFARLVKNIQTNGLKNVVAIQKMLWSRRKESILHLSAYGAAHSAFRDGFYNPTGDFLHVEADTLDNILEELGLQTVDFIKMDIEGSECEALKGMQKTLANDLQIAVAAYHPVGNVRSDAIIIPYLESLGFSVRGMDGGILKVSRAQNNPKDP